MLKPEERFFAELVTKESGIILGEDKSYLIAARLNPLARERGFQTLKEFHDAVKFKVDAHLKRELVEALTTNETLFFRDLTPFKILQNELLPKLRTSGIRPIKIWCAASSTGQEPYSIVMSILEKWPNATPSDFNILCTDIDNTAREKGKSGIYSQIEINRGLPAMMLAKHFSQRGNEWIVSDKVRAFTKWEYINLTQPFTVAGPFDMVFIRNVLIYFEVAVKKRILDRIATMMKPEGALFLGSSETSMGITDAIQSKMSTQGGSYFMRRDAQMAK